jgi:prepilin-type N-terminal cleavage/methylation domain-containing protein
MADEVPVTRHSILGIRHSRLAFTLVELLVVIAIIGIMTSLAIPYFAGMGRGANLRVAVNQVRTTLSLARQWAITRHENAYMVFPHYDGILYQAPYQSHVDKAYRSYSVYTASEGYVQDWKFLPQGVVFVKDTVSCGNDPDVNDNKCIFSAASGPSGKTNSIPFPVTTRPPVGVRVVGFRPDGSSTTQSAEIYITEGWTTVDKVAGTLAGSAPEYRPPGQRVMYSVEIYPLTGRLRIRDYSQ